MEAVIAEPRNDTPQEHRRAMLQSVMRLQRLRLALAEILANFIGLPTDTSVIETESHFMKIMALQHSENRGGEKTYKKLASQFELEAEEDEKIIPFKI